MPIEIGTQLGSHEVIALLGKGGMGEVYRARDLKLKREVAIKILPDEFSRDGDRVSRFQREAEVLASLNHPNIAAIYDLEEASGSRYLVLELVEGETLAERLKRGPIPLEEGLEIAKHICEALEAAHEKDIVHRDLKPANVKITPDDKVKVLDFGLAKAMEGVSPANPSPSNSPTLSLAATQAGVILGTAAYMSPEQAKGVEVDARSDVFSFGCVFYEMLTSRQAFHAESVSEILAAVLIREPDFSGLPPNLNPRILEVLRRCFEKNPKRRWQAVGDLRAEIETIAVAPRATPSVSSTSVQTRPLWKRAIPLVVTAVVFSVIAGVAGWKLRTPAPGRVTRFSIAVSKLPTTGANLLLATEPRRLLEISPDGSKVVFSVNTQLLVREMSEMEPRLVSGAGVGVTDPFFSPDGQWIGFYSGREGALKKVALSGGGATTICKIGNTPLGVHWYGDQIVFLDQDKGIMRVSSDGGEPEVLIGRKDEDGWMAYPQMLDRGRAVLFTLAPRPGRSGGDRCQPGVGGVCWDQSSIVVQQLPSGPRKVLVAGSDARYVSSGHLLYALGGNVLAVPFDLKTLTVKGGPASVIEGVMRAPLLQTGVAHYSISDNGDLAYFPGAASTAPRILALVERTGKTETLRMPPAMYEFPRISPDGKRLAVGVSENKESWVSIYELSGTASLRRLTFGGNSSNPLWSRDGRYIFFRSDPDGKVGIFRQSADGGPVERLSTADPNDVRHIPLSVDPSGTILFEYRRPVGGDSDIWLLPLDGDRKPRALFEMIRFQSHAAFSHNGSWVAYMSNELANRPEIYVQPYPSLKSKHTVTMDGGGEPVWSPDGKQLFYFWDSRIFAVDIRTEPSFSAGPPSPLPITGVIQATGNPRNYDITPDGKLLVVLPATPPDGNQRPAILAIQINVVQNWFRELQEHVPVK
jgi:serine/threonine-protein kinase